MNKVVQRTFKLVEPNYSLFKDQVKLEGYSVDEAINILIRDYIEKCDGQEHIDTTPGE
jgi:uncharacterized protein YggE